MNYDHSRKTLDVTALAMLYDARNMPQDVQIAGMEQLADWPPFVVVWSKLFGDWPIPRSRKEWLAACVRADLSPDLFAMESYSPQDVLAVFAERLAQQKTMSVGKVETETPAKPAKRATVDQRMSEMILRDCETVAAWNSTQWAKFLKCAKSTVVATQAWKRLEMVRLKAKAERRNDRRRKPKGSDLRKD